ncbi:hypothetical protein N474_06680 [Pseudoalteromonas luteoviolacea CPMOR-2]|uniref:Glycosyl transferase family 1 domain-containing protein n=1 Tax=Pseudoalteromonas luteoviolacea DSM 6061 TaxID=1365250 RepID=A0A166WGP5_9GAMM|nr:glycosyltransferase family 4 protein [Pseudoalteromonas luteoviolacea]KZN37373.1 hypothetical protein N475_16915 [Pseudoalteromonas luteoviolacea DSM 6061]KZN59374.1 hypothetical protein N474_06680 [Pseudoalteromonas luteoviolacea CPMOR-2]MBE0387397.1 hypothetical protein [Pseudoalteromonas luteoviolacea DSM 6061]
MRKVLNIADVKPNYKVGGLNSMVNQLVDALESLHYDSQLLYFRGTASKSSQTQYKGLIELFKLLRKNKFDVVIIHSIYHPLYPFIAMLVKISGATLFIQSHGSLTENAFNKPSLKKLIYKPLISAMLKISDKFIFSNESEFSHSIIKGSDKVKYIPNLINFVPQDVDYSPNGNKLVFLGKVDFYYKGIDRMLEGLAELKARGLHAELDIYGYGENKDLSFEEMVEQDPSIIQLLARIDELNLSKSVFFKGLLDPVNRRSLASHYDALVLFSSSEAMPLVISESLAEGLPVLISKETNMGSYVDKFNCGLVLKENVAATIERFMLASNSAKQAMSQNAKNCFANCLDIKYLENIVKELEI